MVFVLPKQIRTDPTGTARKEIVYRLDLAGNFKFLDQSGEQLSGYSCEEVCTMNVADVVAPELVEYVRQQIARVINKRYGAVYEIEIITKDNRRIALETSTQVVRNGHAAEIQGIALPRIRSAYQQARCLDEQFVFGRL